MEELKADFDEARSNRKEAENTLQNAVDDHSLKKRKSDQLLEEKARLEGEHGKKQSQLDRLKTRISKAENREAAVAGEQEKLQIEAEIRGLEEKQRQIQGELDIYSSELKDHAEKIEKARKQERDAKARIDPARAALRDTREIVLDAAKAVIKEATRNTLWKKIEDAVTRLFNKLELPGTLTVGYIFAVITGLAGDFIYYGNNGVNIFHYAQPEDFFLSGYKLLFIPVAGILVLWLILTFLKRVPEKLADYGFPAVTERMALYFPGLIDRLATPIALVLMIYITGPLTAYAVVQFQQWQQSTSDGVAIVLEDPYEYADKLNWVGSNSRYAFFRPAPGQNQEENGIVIIPFDRIACISDGSTDSGSNCRNPGKNMEIEFRQNEEIKGLFERLIETLDRNHRIPQVTEFELHASVEQKMGCKTNQLRMSGLILFGNDKSDLRAQAYYEIDSFLNDKEPPRTTTVFGFASPDGDRGGNKELARERACKVANTVCAVIDQDQGYFEYQAETIDKCGCPKVGVIVEQGEDHFINGIANSRSAVIAACSEVPFDQV